LNAPGFSPLGTGLRQDLSIGVNGGNGTLTYAFTGTASNETGYLHLPGAIAKNFAESHGFDAPDWMVHPQRYPTWGGSGRLDVQLGNSGTVLSVAENLFHSSQQQSSLQFSVPWLASTYLTPDNLTTAASFSIDKLYEREKATTLTSTNTITLTNWSPWSWLPIHGTLGLNINNQENFVLLPRNYVLDNPDSVGNYQLSRGTNQEGTFDLGTSIQQRFAALDIGINVHTSSSKSLSAETGVQGIPLGVSIPTELANGTGGVASQTSYNTATYGWYVQPRFNVGSRLFITPAMRFDGGSASGSNKMNIFPKTDVSYLAIDRREDPLFGVLSFVRPRVAFGIAGVQPGPAQALRVFRGDYSGTSYLSDGTLGTTSSWVGIVGLGNTHLHPERSRELEGGVDLGFGNDRLTLTLTGYNKTRYDAIEAIPLAPSVVGQDLHTGENIAQNIGTIRNTGFEATVGARLLDRQSVGWSVNANWMTDRNRVVSLLAGQLPISNTKTVNAPPGVSARYQSRVTPGYPLYGIWARPLTSYADVNGDGLIEPSEVHLADSTEYLGAPYPDYTLNLSTTVTLLSGRLSVNTAGSYTSGLTQINASSNLFQSVVNDPTSSASAQAVVAAMYGHGQNSNTAFGLIQTVNMLRWTTLSINYFLAPKIAHLFRASSMSIALQGSNLGLHTNYHGKDPDVNAFSTGNQIADTGQLPQPRTWSFRVSLGD
jgi:hypothetical protein